MAETFEKYLEQINVVINDKQKEQFNRFYEMLIEKNKVMNLTAITEYDEVILKHFVDSLAINKYFDMQRPLKLIDVGTGAGFPGIPLKIAFEQLDVTLLDSLNKRIKFIEEVAKVNELDKINPIHGRAEDVARNKEYREKFDICVSRAVANLTSLSEYCLPFVKVGGYFISYKAGNSEEEINDSKAAIKMLGGKIERVENFTLADTDITRTFLFIKKEKQTSAKYPRKAGLPTKEPLKG